MTPENLLSELIANARLSAAAPDLLEAVKEIEWSNNTTWQRDRARAAIAKAEEA